MSSRRRHSSFGWRASLHSDSHKLYMPSSELFRPAMQQSNLETLNLNYSHLRTQLSFCRLVSAGSSRLIFEMNFTNQKLKKGAHNLNNSRKKKACFLLHDIDGACREIRKKMIFKTQIGHTLGPILPELSRSITGIKRGATPFFCINVYNMYAKFSC